MSLNAPAWLTARPIAHRGLHGARVDRVENSLGAAEAAVQGGFAIECDVQASADGEAMVFHDETLDRLTLATGPIVAKTARDIGAVRFRAAAERVPTLPELLARVAGRSPVICEIKSGFDGDMRLADRVAEIAAGYRRTARAQELRSCGHRAGCARARRRRGRRRPCPLGIVAEARYDGEYWRKLTQDQKSTCESFLHYPETVPDFLSYCVDDLPHATPFLLRALRATPVMAWTVRSEAQKRRAAQWADQIVFETDPGA